MSDNYSDVVEYVKGAFFGTLLHEKGTANLVDSLVSQMAEEDKNHLSELCKKQITDVNEALEKLSELTKLIENVETTGKEIVTLVGKKPEVVKDGAVAQNAAVIQSEVSASDSVSVPEIPAVDTQQASVALADATESVSAPSTQEDVSGTQMAVEVPKAETVSNVHAEQTAGATVVGDNISLEPGVVTGSQIVDLENKDTFVPTVTNLSQDAPVVENTPPVPAVNEVVQVAGQTGAIEEEVKTEVPTQGFVLSPIDEGVVPAKVEEQPVVTAAPAAMQPAQIDASMKKFMGKTGAVRKAILVSKEQLEKLAGSKGKQEASLGVNLGASSATQGQTTLSPTPSPTPVAVPLSVPSSTSVAVEVTPAPDKNQQMEAMLAQATELYNAGKTAEAEALSQQVAAMNASGSAPVLVKK